jgi:hypothetical protein
MGDDLRIKSFDPLAQLAERPAIEVAAGDGVAKQEGLRAPCEIRGQ